MSLRTRRALRLLPFAIGIGTVALLLPREHSADAAPPPPSALRVESLIVRVQPGYEVIEGYNGRVVSRRSSRLGFALGGIVNQVLVREGDRVEAGVVLARLDTAKLHATRRELEAQVSETRARLELAQLSLERTAQLAGRDSISQQRHDEARIEEAALRARLAAATAGIEAVDVDLDRSQLKAPYAGSIIRRIVDEGTIVAPGQELLQIIETGAMEVKVGVPSATANSLEIGRGYPVRVEGREVQARLSAITDEIASDTRTVTAVFQIEEPDGGIRHGAMARLALETFHPAPGFWLPLTALAESHRGLWSAYALVGEDGKDLYRLDRRELQLIHTESDRAYLRGTLQDGERVVATGLHRLVPDQRVRLGASPLARNE